ncbi:acyltransferase family protein [Pseudomonas huaxiensis]|uniref:acyltransferase family protein n=1 Tax=Pseudomonas huaxiensis TaxID=2213017 RepID=UPI0013001CBA|nr:acyltransferase family protein [Pseudomonas huaxiensis]
MLKGGFIGVDVFFIISGYLISKILFQGLDKGTFSLFDFYSRRINRIYPALTLVLGFCLYFGWFALLADEYRQLGKHTAAGAGFFANLMLWSESGYFDNISETKPLLHLWSLGIEEQFYIIWPLLLLVLWKSRVNRLFIMLTIASVSFYLNIRTSEVDQAAAFYSPYTRFWELMIGSLLAYFSMYPSSGQSPVGRFIGRFSPTRNAGVRNSQSILGVVMIVIGFWLISKEKAFPGYWALLPTLGAALIIGAGPQALFNKHVLSNRLMVAIGLISFPLYLWHWPLLSFARIIQTEVPSFAIRLGAVVVSIALAWLTYKLVEQPIRFYARGRMKTLILFLAMLVLGSGGFYIYKQGGFPLRPIVLDLQQKTADITKFELSTCDIDNLKQADLSWCNQSKPGKSIDYILWGDSHAEHLITGLGKKSEKNWYLVGRHSCPPIKEVKVWIGQGSKDACEKANAKSLEIIKDSNASVVALGSLGPLYFSDHGLAPEHAGVTDSNPDARFVFGDENDVSNKVEVFRNALGAAVAEITSQGKKVVLIKDVAEQRVDPKGCFSRPFKIGEIGCDISRREYDERNRVYSQILDEVKSKYPGVYLFDAAAVFCGPEKCVSNDDKHIYYRDGHHLTEQGSIAVGKQLSTFVEQIAH